MSRKRYEEEIDEILKKLDGTLPDKPFTERARGKLQGLTAAIGHSLSGILSSVQVGHLMLLSLALMLAAYIFRLSFIGIMGLVLFAIAFILSLLDKRRTHHEPRWRGRVIRYDEDRWPDWLRRLFGKR